MGKRYYVAVHTDSDCVCCCNHKHPNVSFFFQAEDGIRDGTVTGVQTCALPISDALEMGATGEFGLVILDVHMPMYDGVEVLEMLRKRHILHPIKVIALTGDSSEPVRKALEGGRIDAFLTKPVDLDLLHQEVERLTAA